MTKMTQWWGSQTAARFWLRKCSKEFDMYDERHHGDLFSHRTGGWVNNYCQVDCSRGVLE